MSILKSPIWYLQASVVKPYSFLRSFSEHLNLDVCLTTRKARLLCVAILVNFYCSIDSQSQAAVYSGGTSFFARVLVNKMSHCHLNL